MPDRMAFDYHLALRGDGRKQLVAIFRRLQPAHQVGGAAIDEASGKTFV